MLDHILKNSRCKERLIADIDERAGRGQLRYPVQFDEANNMALSVGGKCITTNEINSVSAKASAFN